MPGTARYRSTAAALSPTLNALGELYLEILELMHDYAVALEAGGELESARAIRAELAAPPNP